MINYLTILKENEDLMTKIKRQWPILTQTERFHILNKIYDLQEYLNNKQEIKPYKYKKPTKK